jgi:predicted nucleic-acid-binding Zn-ribbon protein
MLDDQLGFYAVAENIPDVEISFLNSYLHKGKTLPPVASLFALHRYQHTPVGLSVIESNILEKIDKILDTKPHKNYSPTCPNCQFFELCHAETRGINVERIKSLHFRTKVDNVSSVRLSKATPTTSEHTDDNAKFEISFVNI